MSQYTVSVVPIEFFRILTQGQDLTNTIVIYPIKVIFAVQVMSFFATAEHEKERLQYFASAEGRDDLYQYNQKERRTVLEVLGNAQKVLLNMQN